MYKLLSMQRSSAISLHQQVKRYITTPASSTTITSSETRKIVEKSKIKYNNNSKRSNRNKGGNMNIPIAVGCFTFVLACGSMPLYIVGSIKPLQSREEVRIVNN